MLKFLRPKILPEEYYEAEIENDNESILILWTNIEIVRASSSLNLKKVSHTFTFSYVSYKEFLKQMKNLQTAKMTLQSDIAKRYCNKNCERKLRSICQYFHANTIFSIENSIFPSDLKLGDATPALKRNKSLWNVTTRYILYI